MESVEELQEQLIKEQTTLLKLYQNKLEQACRLVDLQEDLLKNMRDLNALLDGRVKELERRLASLN